MSHRLARLVVRVSARFVHVTWRTRWREEWLAEIDALPDGRSSLAYAAGAPWDAVSSHWTTKAGGAEILADLVRDVRYATRHLRRSPGFVVSALLCLAIGIGATTTVYSVAAAILLRPLPFPDSDRLVRIVENVASPNDLRGRTVVQRGITYQEFLEWRAEAKTLVDATAVMPSRRTVQTRQGVARLWGIGVSGDAFALIGGSAMLGRTLNITDADNPGVIVLGFETWRRHFNSDASIIGASVQGPTLPGQAAAAPLIVVGVMPPDFEFPATQLTREDGGSDDFITPVSNAPAQRSMSVTMLARLAPGTALAAARDEASALGGSIRGPVPANAPTLPVARFEVQSLKELIVGPQRPALQALLGSVVIMLLIVCGNLSNLLLARGTARRREIAVQRALGASRGRLVRQMMTESALLALVGGAAGACVAAAGVKLVKAFASVNAPGVFRLNLGSTILPRVQEIDVDPGILGIALGVAALTSILFGTWPALRLSRADDMSREQSRGMSAGTSESTTQSLLVVAQVAMATTLLVGAGLLAHSFLKASTVNNGYEASNVVALNLLIPFPYPVAHKVETIESLLTRFRMSPDIQAAGFSRHGLFIGEQLTIGTFVPPAATPEQFSNVRTRLRSVSGGWLTAMGVPMLDGREFEERDAPAGPPVVVLNRSAARQYFGDARPVGQTLDWHFEGFGSTQVTVLGVVEDLRQLSPLDDVYAEVFVEYRQFLSLLDRWERSPLYQNEWALGVFSFAVKTRDDAIAAIPSIRQAVNAVDPNVAVDSIVPTDQLMSSALARQRFYATFLTLFASISALLAAIGVYGMLACSVSQRTREFGIRIALGSPTPQLLGRVLCRGLILTSTGIAVGLVAAAAATRILQGVLFGVTPLDPATFVAVAVFFGFVTTVAVYVPARRAMRVDPIVALRSE